MIEACQVAKCSHRGDGHGALDPTQGLEGLDDRVSTPSFDLCADELINVGVPGADRAAVDDLGAVVFGNRGDRDGLLMDILSDIERARLWHG
jgi:hypothetical protein